MAFRKSASRSRFFGFAFVSSERRKRPEAWAIWSTATVNERSFAFDGWLKPLIFRTNCSEAARISSSVAGGSKLNRGLMFLHTLKASDYPVHYCLSKVRAMLTADCRRFSSGGDGPEYQKLGPIPGLVLV